ncbi:hypothetical protein ACFV0F_20000, partial [Streptomyces bottropensis]
TALAVGVPWPVLALWWDADRSGYTLAAGFRRVVRRDSPVRLGRQRVRTRTADQSLLWVKFAVCLGRLPQ